MDETVIVANGDSLFLTDYAKFVATPLPEDVSGRLMLREIADAARYGTVETDASGRVTAFAEKVANAGRKTISAGVYLLRTKSLAESATGSPLSLETEIFPAWADARQLEAYVDEGYFIDIGLPETYHQAGRELMQVIRRPAVFLDRDGVINLDTGYAHRPEELAFTPQAIAGIKAINEAGTYALVVTNQAGIARGYYAEADMHRFHAAIQQRLLEAGAHIDAFYFCPYHPDGRVPAYASDHQDRKPNPGMILRALADWPIDRDSSFLIGDRETDAQAAIAAGLPAYLIATDTGDLLAALREPLGLHGSANVAMR
jgi:D-glycero-D-manno-heptose 1,7-bisphosphate phosphatase